MIASVNNKVVLFTGVLLLTACAAVSVYSGYMYISFLPAALMAALLSFNHPQILFYCLVAVIPWSMEYNISSSLGTDVPDEPLMWLTTVVTIALILYNGKRVFKMLPLHPLLLLLFIQLAWSLVTVIFSSYPLLSIKFILAKVWFVLPFVVLPAMLFQSKKEVKWTAIILASSMMMVATIALIRHASFGFTFEKVNESLTPYFRNHVNYAALLVCIIPVVFVLAINAQSKMLKGFLKCCLFILLAALIFSYSRGAWVALVVGVVAYWIIKKGALLKGFLISLFICIAALFWLQHQNNYLRFAPDYQTTIFHTDFEEHLVATYQLKDVSTAERFYRWVAGARMVPNNPITGCGPNTFYYNYKSFTLTAFKTWVSNNPEHSTVHNYFLLTTIEQGIPGLIFLLSLITYMFYTAQKVYTRSEDAFWKNTALCIAVILSMICTLNFLSDLIETDKIGSLFYLCIGFLIIADHQSRKKKEQHKQEIGNV